jgi:hypothetical protein
MTVAGLALSAVSAIGGGIQAKQAGDFNAEQLKNQAEYEDKQAEQVMEKTRGEQRKLDLQAAQQSGAFNARAGASGLSMTSGSLLDIGVGNAREAAIDRQNLFSQGAGQAQGLINQSAQTMAQSSMAKSQGNNALTGGIISGIGSLGLAGAAGYNSLFPDSISKAGKIGKIGKIF